MPVFDRSASTEIEVIDRWEDGFGWMAHPGEKGSRASHVIRGTNGVWVFDPLEGPGVHDRLSELGAVAGVVVQDHLHCRDAGAFADRHGVAVHLPAWMDQVAKRFDAPTRMFEAPPGELVELGESDIWVRTIDPSTAWREMLVYRPTDGTLRIADMLLNSPVMNVGNEEVGCHFFHRFAPPRNAFTDIDPERLLFGHGAGIFDDAAASLEYTLSHARRNLPRALVRQGPIQLVGYSIAKFG